MARSFGTADAKWRWRIYSPPGDSSMPTAVVNGANIYYERRGSGPPLLFICGAFADVDHFRTVSDFLADQFTVVTYDRRGNSRSDGLEPGTPTTANDQADDAAELLKTLGLAPAAVHGNSSGALIALSLLLRHQNVVTAASIHEPPLAAGMKNPQEVGAMIGQVIQQGMAAGGPTAAAETFLRFAMGDANWDSLPEPVRQRAKANGPVFFGSEAGQVDAYAPAEADLRAVTIPTQVVVSTDGLPFVKDVTAWLAERLNTSVVEVPGSHTPQLDHPHELASSLRAFFAPA